MTANNRRYPNLPTTDRAVGEDGLARVRSKAGRLHGALVALRREYDAAERLLVSADDAEAARAAADLAFAEANEGLSRLSEHLAVMAATKSFKRTIRADEVN